MIAYMSAMHTSSFHRKRGRYSRWVWGLVVALLVTYGFGMNRHIHVPDSDSAEAGHAHQVEVHLGSGTGILDNAPNSHEDTDWVLLDIDGPGITKKAPASDFVWALFGALLLLCLLLPSDKPRLRFSAVVYPKRKTYYAVYPPSRAPPR